MVEDGKTVHEWIREYVPLVNAEFGLSDKNEWGIRYFENMIKYSDYIIDDKHYVWVVCSKDMWEVPFMSVLSSYIKPEYRTVGMFRKMQEEIIMLAKSKKIKYILQGSHLNDKLHKVLGMMGYKTSSMRRDI